LQKRLLLKLRGRAVDTEPRRTAGSGLGDGRILIVDDDGGHGRSVRELFTAHGLSADYEADPVAALTRLDSGDYQVLVLDLNMPELTGYDVLEHIQRSDRDIKTIVLSGESEVASVTPILRLGAYDYLPKPYEPQQLLNSVENALGRYELERSNEIIAAEARASRELHEFLVNVSPDLIYMLDDDGRVRYVNRRFQPLLGGDPERVQGEPWPVMLAGRGNERLAQELAHRINERRTGDRATQNFEFDYVAQDGSLRIFEFSALGLYEDRTPEQTGRFTGTYGVLRDVTESRRTARELAQSQRKFYALFKESPDAVFIANLESGELIEGNDHFRTMQQIMLGRNATERTRDSDAFLFNSPEERAQFVHQLKAQPEHLQLDLERTLADGVHYFELNSKLLDIDGQDAVLATLRDLTQERRAEVDRLALQTQLQQASKMEAIGQLAGGIAHDFNNILASIIGYAELVQNARQRLADEQVRNYLSEVISAGQRARDLISQMLTFTRANRGEPRAMDIAAAIDDVSRMLRAAIPSTIDIRTRFGDNLHHVLADPVQLQQIIINLLINARDAIEGNGTIELDVYEGEQMAACVCCGATLSERHVVVEVSDDGHGIEPALQQKIFDMYVTTRDPGKGTGIGLWMVNNLVHEYGGHLTLTSRPGKGSTFRVHLPRAEADAVDRSEQSVERHAVDGAIVVVDDEVSVGNFIGEVLRDHGLNAVIFNESPSALRYLEQHAANTALVITDMAMPMMSGLDLSERARQVRADLPIVLITAFSENRDTQRIERIGIDRFLAKPFRIEELLQTIYDVARVGEPPGAADQ